MGRNRERAFLGEESRAKALRKSALSCLKQSRKHPWLAGRQKEKYMACKKLEKQSASSLMSKEMQVEINWNTVLYPLLTEQIKPTHVISKGEHGLFLPHAARLRLYCSGESPGDLVKCRFWLQRDSKFNMNTDHPGTLLRRGLWFLRPSCAEEWPGDLVKSRFWATNL